MTTVAELTIIRTIDNVPVALSAACAEVEVQPSVTGGCVPESVITLKGLSMVDAEGIHHYFLPARTEICLELTPAQINDLTCSPI